MMFRIDRQFFLSAVIVALLLGALFVQRFPNFSYLQIIISILAVAASIGAVSYRGQSAKEPANDSVDTKGFYDSSLTEENLSVAIGPIGKWSGKHWAQIYANDEPSLSYAALYRESPIVQDGNHFHCDIDYPSDYTLTVGMMDIEVSDGEAKITMRSKAQQSGARLQDRGRTPIRTAKLHS